MKRLVMTAFAVAALMVPTTMNAQEESPGLVGVTTFDVCLAISGPVIQLTPEALTEGISDGTFIIEGLSNDCDQGLQAPDDSDEMGSEEGAISEEVEG